MISEDFSVSVTACWCVSCEATLISQGVPWGDHDLSARPENV